MVLKELRLKAGMTQADMSKVFDIPKRTIENWETGTRKCPGYVEKLIAEKLEDIIMSNKNIMGQDAYYASVSSPGTDGSIHWGFNVKLEHGDVFTIELANELLDIANREYKKGCPDGYCERFYDPSKDFTYIKYDMSNYHDAGDEHMILIGDKKVGTYDREKNLLRIYKDGDPIYENNNGVICRDTVAMMDDAPVYNHK